MILKLTPREREIIELIALEYSTKQISNILFISFETVRTHRKNLFSKMQVKNVAGLIRVAFERNILSVSKVA